MKVSVIIPTYNSEEAIEECLLSMVNQTYKPFEIIVVDGGSSDSTVKIVKKFDVRLMINEKSHMPGASRNLAAESARGDILFLMDSDCFADHKVLEYHIRCYRKRGDIVGVKGAIRSLARSRISDFIQRQFMASQWLNSNPDGIMRLFHAGPNFSIYKPVFLSKKFREDLVSCEDTELFIRIKKDMLKVLYEPRAFVFHHHPTTLKGLFEQRKWHGEGIYHLVKIHGKDFSELYPLFSPEKFAYTPEEELHKAVFSDNRLLCNDCQLEPHLGCRISQPKISETLAGLSGEIPETEIRRAICLAVAAGILKQRTGADYQCFI